MPTTLDTNWVSKHRMCHACARERGKSIQRTVRTSWHCLKMTVYVFAPYSNMPAEWACTHIDCPEFLGGKPLHSGCRHAYTPKIFCATGEICPEDVSTLHVCHYRGVKAVKGERFVSPTDPCIQCTCTENFQDNIFVWSEVNAKNCARFNCGYETLYKDKVHANCAPVYCIHSNNIYLIFSSILIFRNHFKKYFIQLFRWRLLLPDRLDLP